ncbi:hypothetical protein H0H92_013122 [Tricholoma furcatifolium]|nr:hypothetical protein H0H92_013122 [Tricholoma furcatifolium]
MANGTVITPVGRWDGVVEAGGLCREAAFEVFDSGGGWDFLFGKRLLMTFGAVHDYTSDTIQLSVDGACATLHNQIEVMSASMPKEREKVSLVGDMTSPSRGVPARSLPSDAITEHPFDAAPQPENALNLTSPIHVVLDDNAEGDEGSELPVDELLLDPNIYTRCTDPF